MKLSIYIGPPLAAVLEGAEERGKSARINEVAARYLEMRRQETPALAEAEWCAICDVLNGTLLDSTSIRLLWAEIEDAALDGVGQKWGIDLRALAIELKELRYSQLVAIAEVVERFWRTPPSEGQGHREMLVSAGARMI